MTSSSLVPWAARRVADAISDPQLEPYNEREINASFDPNGTSPAGEAVVVTLLQNSPCIVVGGSFGGKVKLYWGFNKVHAHNHPYDGQLLCIEGELTAQGYFNVVRPSEAEFAVGPETEVYSVDETIAAFEADSTKAILTPPASTRRTSTPIKRRYRRFFRIPHQCAGALMSFKDDGITARSYFLEFYPTLDTPEKKDAWKTVTEQFQVLAVAAGAGNKSAAELRTAPELVGMDDVVGKNMHKMVCEVLPALRDGGAGRGLNQFVANVVAHVTSPLRGGASHKEACKTRAAELRDELLFKQPESTHLGDCPICMIPLLLDRKKSPMYSCCSKTICNGCYQANMLREFEAKMKCNNCPFCREAIPKTAKGMDEQRMKRIKMNDSVALTRQGGIQYEKGDYSGAFEYCTKAADSGDVEAHFSLAYMYGNGEGVEKDGGKAIRHAEDAAIGGHPKARYSLGLIELKSSNNERAVKHLVIAATQGQDESMKALLDLFKRGFVTKEDLTSALRAHHAAVDATKSPQRDAAEEFMRKNNIV